MNIELPCSVGDYVYRLDKSQKKIETKRVRNIQIHIGYNGRLAHIEFEVCGFCSDSDFGITIFTNRADALHALDKYLNKGKP